MISAEYRTVDKRMIEIDDRELSARLGRVCSHTDPELFRVYESVMKEAEPRYAVKRIPIAYPGEGAVELGFYKAESVALTKTLEGATEALVVACTLGAGVDRLIAKLSKISRAEAFIYDAMASALAEAVAELMHKELSRELNLTQRFSPGYGDFSLECQSALLDFLGAPHYLGVSVGDTNLMTPMKTITAIIGIK